MTRSSYVPLLAVLVACGGQTLEVGSNGSGGSGQMLTQGGDANSGVGGASPGGGSGSASASACTGTLPFYGPSGGSGPVMVPESFPDWPEVGVCPAGVGTLQGTWSGYVQASTLYPDFVLSLEGDGTTPCGTITFGEPVEYPPATNPGAGYLAQEAPTDYGGPKLLPGFSYTLLDAELVDHRMLFRIGYAEPWRHWCELQTPYCDEKFGGYYCSDASDSRPLGDDRCTASDSSGAKLGELSCAQISTCRGNEHWYCDCNAGGCVANQATKGPSFDLHVEGDSAEGALSTDLAVSTTYLNRD